MGSEEEMHTVSRMPKPANTAFAGGNGCGIAIRNKAIDEWFWTYDETDSLVKGRADRGQAQDVN